MSILTPTSPSKPKKLRGAIYPSVQVNGKMLQEMWDLFVDYYADINYERFRNDLYRKSHVVCIFEKKTGILKGFSTLQALSTTIEGRFIRAVFSGDTVVDRAYWGQTTMQQTIARFFLMEWLKNPFRPLYWFLISKGYKTYLLLTRNWRCYWPRYDQPTPPYEQKIINQLAQSMFGEDFKPERGIVSFSTPQGRLKEGVGQVSESLLANRDIAFFAKMNPRYNSGDELCTLGQFDLRCLIYFVMRTIEKSFRGRQRAPVAKRALDS